MTTPLRVFLTAVHDALDVPYGPGRAELVDRRAVVVKVIVDVALSKGVKARDLLLYADLLRDRLVESDPEVDRMREDAEQHDAKIAARLAAIPVEEVERARAVLEQAGLDVPHHDPAKAWDVLQTALDVSFAQATDLADRIVDDSRGSR